MDNHTPAEAMEALRGVLGALGGQPHTCLNLCRMSPVMPSLRCSACGLGGKGFGRETMQTCMLRSLKAYQIWIYIWT